MRNDHSIVRLCENLLVSPSGFYDRARRRATPGGRAREDQALAEQITAIHAASRQTYGAPRIALELRDRGARHGRNRIARLMKSRGLCGRQRGRYRVQTTDSNHDPPDRSQSPRRGTPDLRSRPDPGRRHHRRRLALPRRRHGSPQPPDRRLGHGSGH